MYYDGIPKQCRPVMSESLLRKINTFSGGGNFVKMFMCLIYKRVYSIRKDLDPL